MYNYREEMKQDILNSIEAEGYKITADNKDEMYEKLIDEFWADDSITGNSSGSYYCNAYAAKEALEGNADLVREMCKEFCIDAETIATHFLDEDYEWFDVCVRCCLLGEVLGEVLDEIAAA